MKRTLLAAVLAILAMPAAAHTPYFAPATFQVQPGATITLDASFSEAFFVPEAAFDDSHFMITGPDGRQGGDDDIANTGGGKR